MPTPQGHLQEAFATTRMISIPIIWSLLHMLPQREALAPTNKIATIIIGVLLLVPTPQWHPHEAQATCKTSYVTRATATAILHCYVLIPFARSATAKVTSHGSATSIKTRWSRRRKVPPPRKPSSKRRAVMIKLQSLLPPPSMQVHLWRRPWRRRR